MDLNGQGIGDITVDDNDDTIIDTPSSRSAAPYSPEYTAPYTPGYSMATSVPQQSTGDKTWTITSERGVPNMFGNGIDRYDGDIKKISTTMNTISTYAPSKRSDVDQFLNYTHFPVLIKHMSTMEYTVLQGVCIVATSDDLEALPNLDWEANWVKLERYGMPKVFLDDAKIVDSEAALSATITSLTNSRSRLNAGSKYVRIWFDIVTSEMRKGGSNPNIAISGPSLGLSVFAACNGLAPMFYTGFTRNLSPYYKRVNTFVRGDGNMRGHIEPIDVPSLNRDDTVENVDGLPLKIQFALANNMPIVIPHVSTLNQSLSKLLAKVPIDTLRADSGTAFEIDNVRAKRPYMVAMGQLFWTYEHQLCGMTFGENFAPVILCSTLTETILSCTDTTWLALDISGQCAKFLSISNTALSRNLDITEESHDKFAAHVKMLRENRKKIMEDRTLNLDSKFNKLLEMNQEVINLQKEIKKQKQKEQRDKMMESQTEKFEKYNPKGSQVYRSGMKTIERIKEGPATRRPPAKRKPTVRTISKKAKPRTVEKRQSARKASFLSTAKRGRE